MANSYTTTDLVNNVLLIAHVPVGNNTFTNANIITLADRELQTAIIAQILSTRGGYYLTYKDYAPTVDGLYQIPSDCIAATLENVEMVQDTTIVAINPLEPSEQYSTQAPSTTTYGFYMRGNYIQILPTTANGVIRIWYSRRPSRLVPISQCAQILALTGVTYSVSSLPSNIIIGSSIDGIGDQPPFELIGQDTVFDIVGTDITLTTGLPSLAVGDWIALNNQTPIPQIPVEFRVLLEQRVVVKIYELQGFAEKMKMAQMKLTELEKSAFSMITPRVKSQTKIISAGRGGFLSGSRGRRVFPAGK